MNKSSRSLPIRFALLALFLFVLIRTAWVADDAFITFRTIENFLQGYGLTYNVGYRVQAFTHPLWALLLSSVYFILYKLFGISFTGELYLLTIALSLALSVGTVFLITFRIVRDVNTLVIVVLLLTVSKSFTDYSTSGLENPLVHFLLVLFFATYLRVTQNGPQLSSRSLLLLSSIASLTLITRMDAGLLLVPICLTSFTGAIWTNRRRGFYAVCVGMIPFLSWEVFSLFYYGYLWPNTAYAKLNTGISAGALLKQGLSYILNSINLDPVTLLVIVFAVITTVCNRELRSRLTLSIVFGLIAYLLYVVAIGGCFMSGRFLSSPFLIALVLLSRMKIQWSASWLSAAAGLVGLTLFSPYSPLRSGSDYGIGSDLYANIDHRGIADERAFYYPATGLLRAHSMQADTFIGYRASRDTDQRVEMPFVFVPQESLDTAAGTGQSRSPFYTLPESPWARDYWVFKKNLLRVAGKHAIGIFGYANGPNVHVLDDVGLADPLLSKLPTVDKNRWRIGHFQRTVPEGYEESLRTAENRIADRELAEYYGKLLTVVRGDLLSISRLVEIWRLNTGYYDHLLPASPD